MIFLIFFNLSFVSFSVTLICPEKLKAMSNTAVPCTHIKQEYWSVSNQKILSENCISIDCFPLLVYLTELDHARNDSDCVLLVVLLVLCGKNLFKNDKWHRNKTTWIGFGTETSESHGPSKQCWNLEFELGVHMCVCVCVCSMCVCSMCVLCKIW